MENSVFINATCNELLRALQLLLKQCWKEVRTDKDNIEECCYHCNECWEKLRNLVSDHVFQNITEEIYFFRYIKPAVTSELEFYSLLYQADMFKPETGRELIAFWKREERRLKDFTTRHPSFYQYYRSGSKEMDEKYFTRNNGSDYDFTAARLYAEDSRSRTGYDHLLACIMAQERYHLYVKEKLNELNKLKA